MRVVAVGPSLLLALGMLVAWASPPASAQTHSCGDITLVFRNPDLQPREDELIHASGQIFIQFQAIGEAADQIEVFGFSFGPDTREFDETACAQDPWITGAYIPNYRADRNPDDGFFIPLKTSLVPDGTYAAAVHAYDGSNNELARFWARAVVDNCDEAATPAQERCDGDAAQNQAHDTTAPWPIVLPGDGQPLEGQAWTVEFAEELSSFRAFLNGVDVTANMTDWDGRLWDADVVPDYGPEGLGAAVSEPCSQPYHTCIKYGPAYSWNGRPLTRDDVIRIEATDLSNNSVAKDIHLASAATGGAVTELEPKLGFSVVSTEAEAARGGTALFQFSITNTGGSTAHPFAEAKVPEGWQSEWVPPHQPVDPGQTMQQELHVKVPSTATDGRYDINATLTYQAAGVDKVLAQSLSVVVGHADPTPPSCAPGAPTCAPGPGGGDGKKGSPAAPAALAAAAIGAVAFARRRA